MHSHTISDKTTGNYDVTNYDNGVSIVVNVETITSY